MKVNDTLCTNKERVGHVAGGFAMTFQFHAGTIRKSYFVYLCTQLAGSLVSITQSKLGVATVRRCGIGTGARGSTNFCSKKERNSLQAAPSLAKRFLFLLDEEMEHFTFSGINLLAPSHNISAENFPFFGLFGTHSSKMVCGATISVIQGTRTAYKPDCWHSQAYSFDSSNGTIKVLRRPASGNFNAVWLESATKLLHSTLNNKYFYGFSYIFFNTLSTVP